MTDLDIIKAYDNNELSGVTVTDFCFFMPVRITGLGKTLRIDDEGTIKNLQQKLQDFSTTDLKTIVEKAKSQKVDINDYVSYKIYDRDPEAFSNDDILEAYQGLPILKDHPKSQGNDGALLTSENLNKNKIIGAIIKAYRKNEAVWGLARIYDMSLLDELNKFQSTSPAVYSIDIEKPNGVINEQPNVFNHLAFVENGHWDCVDKNPYDAEKLNIITYDNEVIQGDFMTNETTEASKQIDESSEDLKKDVEELKEAESKEAEHFKEMSEDHKNIKEDEEMPLNKVDNEIVKTDEDEVKTDEDEVKTDEDEVKTDEDEVKTDEDENLVDEEMESIEDEERDELIDNFRSVIDSAHPSLKLKMPYFGKERLKPSVVISKILKANSSLVDSKYKGLLLTDSDRSMLNYQLKVEAYNKMIDNISSKTDSLRKTEANKKGYWSKTENPNVSIDRNF